MIFLNRYILSLLLSIEYEFQNTFYLRLITNAFKRIIFREKISAFGGLLWSNKRESYFSIFLVILERVVWKKERNL